MSHSGFYGLKLNSGLKRLIIRRLAKLFEWDRSRNQCLHAVSLELCSVCSPHAELCGHECRGSFVASVAKNYSAAL